MSTEVLSADQVAFYRDHGYLVLPNRVPMEIVGQVREEITRLCAPARTMTKSDENLDLEESHRPDQPRVRRIKLPHTQSSVIDDLMRSDWILGPARDLEGPNLRLHTSKLNLKAAGYGAAIEWHQDFAFYPHTNDSVLAIGVILDDMALENGPLMVFPGSHKEQILDHHVEGVFAGAIDMQANALDPAHAVALTGPAGSISIHHGRIIHGSALNTSARDRRLLFYEMTAVDAFPIFGSISPFKTLEEYDANILCGEPTLHPRLEPVPVRIPQPQPGAYGSIYEVQKRLKSRSFDRLPAE